MRAAESPRCMERPYGSSLTLGGYVGARLLRSPATFADTALARISCSHLHFHRPRSGVSELSKGRTCPSRGKPIKSPTQSSLMQPRRPGASRREARPPLPAAPEVAAPGGSPAGEAICRQPRIHANDRTRSEARGPAPSPREGKDNTLEESATHVSGAPSWQAREHTSPVLHTSPAYCRCRQGAPFCVGAREVIKSSG